MTTRPLGAQISHMLAARGVDTIFGIPGVHNQEMYRGIEEAGITHILARHEQGAGFMADGYARATGQMGVCYVITGPGLTNALTPLGQAYSDSVAVLAISSCLDETVARRGQLHQMKDQRAAAEAVCAWSEEARSAAAAYTLIDRAFAEFETDRHRPKHIQVPIAQLEAQASPPPPVVQATGSNGPLRAMISAEKLRPVAERIAAARRPIFVFGGGIASEGAGRALSRLIEHFRAASFTTYAGRGCVRPETPLTFGASLARPDSAHVLASSDCAVVFGSDLAEVDLWRSDSGLPEGATIYINTDPEALARARPGDTCVHCDALDAASMIPVGEHEVQSLWTQDEVDRTRARWRAEVDAERPGIVPVADALRQCLPDATMIYSDMTQFAYTAKEVWDMDRPRHWHHPTGFGTLGYALPAAIGGAVARRGQPTMAIAGDYGFQYTLQELGTAVELGLPLPIFLWDNGKLKEIEDSMVRAQIPPNAVTARNPDFVALAKAYSANGIAPRTLDEMQEATHAAFHADGPTLIHVRSDIAA
ncbi:MAG: thiamine pyrophosphate-binding protein [Pseudomonadota bacterium]